MASRAKRLQDAVGSIEGIPDRLREIAGEMNVENLGEKISEVNEALGGVDVSEVESLWEEIDNWRSGLEGTNLENSQKYSDLEKCAYALESLKDSLESIDSVDELGENEEVTEEKVEEVTGAVESIADELENALSEADGIDFPTMFS